MAVFILLLVAAALPGSNADLGKIISGATTFTGGSAPVVKLDYASFKGISDSKTGTYNYLGMPFGNAPRFDHSTLITKHLAGVQDASDYGPACPQHEAETVISPSDFGVGALSGVAEAILLQPVLRQAEDCLNINVQMPANISSNAKLPVMLWIHGGGFEGGSSAAIISETTAFPGVAYQGANIVQRSVEMGKPLIFVSANYRLNAFGFSASREMEEEGVLNLGLEDQRLAMKWMQKYIQKFGGDPTKVTIFGESAGSWSVAIQMVANGGDTEGLFRAVIGSSGGPIRVDGAERQQGVFNNMVAFTGCSSAANKLACLRKAPYAKVYGAMQEAPDVFGYNNLAGTWLPRPGGKFLPDSPHRLVESGRIANVPLMIGDMRDEGPLFSLINQMNVTTEDEWKSYYHDTYWPTATDSEIDELAALYPENPAKGSPFGTGNANELSPQYKRLAALTGDYSFQSQRRQLLSKAPGPKYNSLLENAVPAVGTLSAVGQGNKSAGAVPILGSFHASDVFLYTFGTVPAAVSPNTRNVMGTLISFVTTLDPNNHGLAGLPHWPLYTETQKGTFLFAETGPGIIQDTYREKQMDYINAHADSFLI